MLRFVVSIDENFTPPAWYSMEPRPNEPGVKYVDSRGREGVLYLRSFASWCGDCVADATGEDFALTGVPFDVAKLEGFKEL